MSSREWTILPIFIMGLFLCFSLLQFILALQHMANFLSSLKSMFQGHSSGSVLGIDISSSSVKVVQGKIEGSHPVLETYGEISLGPYIDKSVGQAVSLPADRLTEALQDLMTEAKVTSNNSGVSIPFNSSFVSIISVPTTDDKKLKSIVPIEARKYIPVPVSEVTLDWQKIPNVEHRDKSDQGNPSTRVLVAAIHNEVISKYKSIISASNLSTSFLEIELFSTIRSVLGHGIKTVAIIDLGVTATKIYIVDHGIIQTSHTINQGAQDITHAIARSLSISFAQAEQMKRKNGLRKTDAGRDISQTAQASIGYLFSEIRRVLLNHEKRYNKPVHRAYLTGGGALLEGLPDQVQEELDLEVTLADPFSKLKTPAFLDETLQEAGPEFAVAVGVLLRKLQEVS